MSNPKEPRYCLQCGKIITKYGNKKYCSMKCYGDSMRGKKKPSSKIKKICLNCGKVFWVYPYRKNTAKYCSNKCQVEADFKIPLEKRKTKCEWCGKIFYRKHSGARFCSRKCANQWTTLNRKPPCGFKFTKQNIYSSLEKIMKKRLENQNRKFIHNKKIGKYFVDFFLPDENRIIEIDGYWHRFRDPRREIERDNYLKKLGYIVEHISASELKS